MFIKGTINRKPIYCGVSIEGFYYHWKEKVWKDYLPDYFTTSTDFMNIKSLKAFLRYARKHNYLPNGTILRLTSNFTYIPTICWEV